MVKLTLGTNYWNRSVPQEFVTPLKNRFLEQNPVSITGVSAILRPGLKRYLSLGVGPIRGMYSEPGNFDGDLFVASGAELYQVKSDNTNALLGALSASNSRVEFTSTGNIGDTPAYLFIVDGQSLKVYAEDGFAIGTLRCYTVDGISEGDTVQIGEMYYQWTAGNLDPVTPPDGSALNPWLMRLEVPIIDNLRKLLLAVNGTGEPGTDYSNNLIFNPLAQVSGVDENTLTLRAIFPGVAGNAVDTVVIVGANLTFDEATLTGGGDASFTQVQMPDDKAVVSVATLAGYVLVTIGPNQNENGRFYWIEPGETIIRPLNFATAEQAPDATLQSLVLGDTILFFGQTTTETWYASGNPDKPFQRSQGNVFSRGSWEDTAKKVRDTLMIVDTSGVVYALTGGAPSRVSNPGVEQLLRQAIMQQRG